MTFFLAAGAIIPGIVLLVYMFRKDRADKEPIKLLLSLLGLGAVIVFPILLVSAPVEMIILAIFGTDASGVENLSGISYYLYNLVEAFFGVALIEEGFKWLVLYFVTRNNKNFNSLFDGIIYAVFVSLGFAIFENLLYVFEYGFETAIIRAFTAVPGHMFDGVIMGYFYTLWHAETAADKIEKHFIAKGLLPSSADKFRPAPYLALSFVVPVAAHGIYDFCCFVEDVWATLLFYAFLIGLYVFCFRTINKMSKKDMGDFNYSVLAFNSKYPELQQALIAYVQEIRAAAMAASVYTAPGTQSAPYGTQQSNPYGAQQSNPYGAQQSNPYGTQQGNPYGAQQSNPYDTQQNNKL